MEHVLELKNISHSYHNTEGETPALKELSFFLKKGEFISIVGPSGCGKSTLLSLIAGLLIPESGTILINGKQLKESTTNIGYMLQRDHLFEWRTIYNNVILGLEIQHMLAARTRRKAHQLLEQNESQSRLQILQQRTSTKSRITLLVIAFVGVVVGAGTVVLINLLTGH